MEKKNMTVPVFFAVDDNYAPFLSVALQSLIEHSSINNTYKIFVLSERLSQSNKKKLLSMQKENVTIEFVSVTQKMSCKSNMLHLRDYYSKATYYRFFIPELFPQYEKGIYLDCDIVILTDIAKLFHTDLGRNYLGAVQEEVMMRYPVFGSYVETVLNIPREEYFSAGILLMNLSRLREIHLEEQFVQLLRRKAYRVTQDQDYLNVLCYHHTKLLDISWNKTAFPDANENDPGNIVHYKINWKPWHYDHITYGNCFWMYAKNTPYFKVLSRIKRTYSIWDKERDEIQYQNLVALAYHEIQTTQEQLENNNAKKFVYDEQLSANDGRIPV